MNKGAESKLASSALSIARHMSRTKLALRFRKRARGAELFSHRFCSFFHGAHHTPLQQWATNDVI
jgi:hypothetical protein